MSGLRSLDLVLVNPASRAQVYQSLGATLVAIEPPVWAGLMATFVRNRGCAVEVVDAEAEALSPEETAARVVEMHPTLTAVVVYGHQPSASTQNMPAAGAVCAAIKRLAPGLKTILVGGHVAALPERTLLEEVADFACGGEGPFTLVGLLEVLKSGAPSYDRVPGLYYRDGEGVRSNGPARLVQDLDREMPALAWDLLPMERYRAHNWHCFGHLRRHPYGSLYTTLGCPYHCTFCCIQAPFRSGEKALGYKANVNTYRLWSPQSVIAQVDTLVHRYAVRNIKIADEMFVLNMSHVNSICDLLIERRYDLNIWAYARVDTVGGDQILEKLKKAGVNWLAFGIESANSRVRQDVAKGFQQDLIFKTIARVRAAGISVVGNFIFGLPEDDLETMQETLNMALELNCEFANFYCAMAYPGSSLYGKALQEGWSLPPTWSGYSQHSVDTCPLPTKYLTSAEVLQFRDRAFQTYFRNRNYQAMIERKFGPATTDHVREMAARVLDRNHVQVAP